MMMILLPLLVDAINRWNRNDTNLLTISSCMLLNASQLHHYCTHVQQDEKSAVTLGDLNTIEISERLCGEYVRHQGWRCYDIVLLLLKSDTKGLCISSSIANVSNRSMTEHVTHTSIINDINHQYFSYCGSVGSLPVDHYTFSCTLKDFDELEKVEFIIRGYDFSIADLWRATVTVTILHHCSEEASRTTLSHYVEILVMVVSVSFLVAMVIFCIIISVEHKCLKKFNAEAPGVQSQGHQILHGDASNRDTSGSHSASENICTNLEDNSMSLEENNLEAGSSMPTATDTQQSCGCDHQNVDGFVMSNLNALNYSTGLQHNRNSLETTDLEARVLTLPSTGKTLENTSTVEDADSEMTVPSVSNSCGQIQFTEPCNHQQVTSPDATLTRDSLPPCGRNSMSFDTLKRMNNTSDMLEASQQEDTPHTIVNTSSTQNDELVTSPVEVKNSKEIQKSTSGTVIT